jgi:hypothetical protein
MKKLFIAVFCAFLFVGCATQQEKAYKRIQCTCESLMGCSEEEVALELGAPQNIQNIGDLTVYQYYKSYGSRSYVNAYSLCGEIHTWESYDKIEIFFRDGCVINWKCSVKR